MSSERIFTYLSKQRNPLFSLALCFSISRHLDSLVPCLRFPTTSPTAAHWPSSGPSDSFSLLCSVCSFFLSRLCSAHSFFSAQGNQIGKMRDFETGDGTRQILQIRMGLAAALFSAFISLSLPLCLSLFLSFSFSLFAD